MSDKIIPSPLPGFDREAKLAEDLGVHQASLARPRKKGLIEYVEWGGWIFDKVEGPNSVTAYIQSKIKRRNPPRVHRSGAVKKPPA